jgi:hypothetical protein
MRERDLANAVKAIASARDGLRVVSTGKSSMPVRSSERMNEATANEIIDVFLEIVSEVLNGEPITTIEPVMRIAELAGMTIDKYTMSKLMMIATESEGVNLHRKRHGIEISDDNQKVELSYELIEDQATGIDLSRVIMKQMAGGIV